MSESQRLIPAWDAETFARKEFGSLKDAMSAAACILSHCFFYRIGAPMMRNLSAYSDLDERGLFDVVLCTANDPMLRQAGDRLTVEFSWNREKGVEFTCALRDTPDAEGTAITLYQPHDAEYRVEMVCPFKNRETFIDVSQSSDDWIRGIAAEGTTILTLDGIVEETMALCDSGREGDYAIDFHTLENCVIVPAGVDVDLWKENALRELDLHVEGLSAGLLRKYSSPGGRIIPPREYQWWGTDAIGRVQKYLK